MRAYRAAYLKIGVSSSTYTHKGLVDADVALKGAIIEADLSLLRNYPHD